jgi:hypothetical protein
MMIGVPDVESSAVDEKTISVLIESSCRSASRVAVADKAILYAQGEPASALFLILDGFVKTSHICEDGTEIIMDLLKCGEIAGEFSNPQLPLLYEETARGATPTGRTRPPPVCGRVVPRSRPHPRPAASRPEA